MLETMLAVSLLITAFLVWSLMVSLMLVAGWTGWRDRVDAWDGMLGLLVVFLGVAVFIVPILVTLIVIRG